MIVTAKAFLTKALLGAYTYLNTFISSEIAASDTPKYENNLMLVERPRNQAIEVWWGIQITVSSHCPMVSSRESKRIYYHNFPSWSGFVTCKVCFLWVISFSWCFFLCCQYLWRQLSCFLATALGATVTPIHPWMLISNTARWMFIKSSTENHRKHEQIRETIQIALDRAFRLSPGSTSVAEFAPGALGWRRGLDRSWTTPSRRCSVTGQQEILAEVSNLFDTLGLRNAGMGWL